MIYADTDFFAALLKDDDWLKDRARTLYQKYKGQIWTSPITLIELLLLADEFKLDPERLLVDAVSIAKLRGGDPHVFLLAAHHMKEKKSRAFDSLHAAFCGDDRIISSDKVFDKLGLRRIRLERGAA